MEQSINNAKEGDEFSRYEQLRNRLNDPSYSENRMDLAELVRKIGEANRKNPGFIETSSGPLIDSETTAVAIENGSGEKIPDDTIARAASSAYLNESLALKE
jgi:hypothetical protein